MATRGHTPRNPPAYELLYADLEELGELEPGTAWDGLEQKIAGRLKAGDRYLPRAHDKNTPLYIAAELGSVDIVSALLDRGEDINRKSGNMGYGALHAAALAGHEDVILLLLTRGADINLSSSYGETPLHQSRFSDARTMSLLLAHGADDRKVDAWSEEPLEGCKVSDYLELVALNLEKDTFEQLPYNKHMNTEMLQRILAMGVPAQTLQRVLFSMYERMKRPAGPERSRMLSLLLDAGLDPLCRNETGNSILDQMCRHGAPAKDIALLLDAGAEDDINRKNSASETPIIRYIKSQTKPHIKGLEVLLEHNADPSLRDMDGANALQCLRTVAYNKIGDVMLRKVESLLVNNGCPDDAAQTEPAMPETPRPMTDAVP